MPEKKIEYIVEKVVHTRVYRDHDLWWTYVVAADVETRRKKSYMDLPFKEKQEALDCDVGYKFYR